MKKYLSLLTILILATAGLWFVGCKKDDERKPEDWTPRNLQVNDLSIFEKELTWGYNGIGELDGFKIDRKIDGNEWEVEFETLPAEARSWTDTNIIPVPAETYHYRLYAYYGNEISNTINLYFNSGFQAPSNATVLISKPLTEAQISWEDNCTGEEGYRIDKLINDDVWQEAYVTLPANTENILDTNLFRGTNISYRIYAFADEYESGKTATELIAVIPGSTDFKCDKISILKNELTWDYQEGYVIDHFIIERKDVLGNIDVVDTTKNLVAIDSTFQLNNFYTYSIKAAVGVTESEKNYISVNTNFEKPKNLNIQRTEITKVELSWSYDLPGLDGFLIERSYDNNTWFDYAIAEDTLFIDESFELNQHLFYRVSGFVDDYATETISADISSSIPSPDNIKINTLSFSAIKIEWDKFFNEEGGFILQKSLDGEIWDDIYNAPSGTNSFVDNDVSFVECSSDFYHYRIATVYSNYQSEFIEGKKSQSAIVDSRDGNIYNTTIIGNDLCWFTENLKWLPSVSPPEVEDPFDKHYYVLEYYGYSVGEAKAHWSYIDYGVLYNWPAANEACPEGWHLTTLNDVDNLQLNIGWAGVAGGKLKEKGTEHWEEPNVDASDEYGFQALPAGHTQFNSFRYSGVRAFFWTANTPGYYYKHSYQIYNDSPFLFSSYSHSDYGLSVRCVKEISK